MTMIGLIPAAGAGTRLQPWTKALPKEMLQIGDKPIIEHVIDQFKTAEIEKIFIIVGYRKEAIMNYLGNGSEFGVKVAYLFQEKKEGLGHAIYEANDFIDEPIVVVERPRGNHKGELAFQHRRGCDEGPAGLHETAIDGHVRSCNQGAARLLVVADDVHIPGCAERS